jgi:hypothetical protein
MAYAPGLKRKELVLVRKRRILPLAGEVLVKEKAVVTPETVVARTYLPGNPIVVNVAEKLGLEPGVDEITYYMAKKSGEAVKKGEAMAKSSSLFGLFKKEIPSPIDGSVESISNMTGIVVLREPPVPVELKAYIPGIVTQVMPKEGCVVETPAAFIQGIFGIGGEVNGPLKVVESGSMINENVITPDMKGKIVVAPSSISIGALRKAAQVGVKGIVTSCIDEKELTEFMGYEVGVAITGTEEAGLTLIATEGFGNDMPMSKNTLSILKSFDGKMACINGATQIRAGVLRPEVIVPRDVKAGAALANYDVEDTQAVSEGLKPGILIRIIREPYFGLIGHVSSLPPELQVVETGSTVRVLEAELEDGRRVIVPRANVEIISE